ncbi:hypothetical protein B0H13DRAFT_2391639 [Mycena leptocephala]|nr:hypothetical protein B0H13DRAFT_2391639 [Mycena leptocephala]
MTLRKEALAHTLSNLRKPAEQTTSSPGRKIPLQIYKGSLEDSQGQDLLQVSVVGNIDKNETSAALATSTVRIPIPGSIQLAENYAELYLSNRWMDTETYLQSAQTISEACSAALLNHDYTYFMDEADKTWLNNTNYQCRIEEPIAQETPSAETDEIFIRVSISEDEFELMMGLFEILTGPKLQQELPDFSFFKPFFLAHYVRYFRISRCASFLVHGNTHPLCSMGFQKEY